MKGTRPATSGPQQPGQCDNSSDSFHPLQPCSLDSNSLPPPPCTPGVGRKCPGEQNILPVPPCSSQAFLGKPGDRTAHLLTAYEVKSQLWAFEEGLSVPGHSHPRIQDDDPKGRASSIFWKNITMRQSWERKGREGARCATDDLIFSPSLLGICIHSFCFTAVTATARKNLWARACLLNEILRATHMISDRLL